MVSVKMGKKEYRWIMVLVVLLFCWSALPAAAQKKPDSWQFKYALRIWGIDLTWNRTGPDLVPGVETEYFCSLGGGLETFGFYREPDGQAYVPPATGANRALYKDANLTWSIGLEQGLIYDLGRQRNLWEMLFCYHGRYDHHLVEQKPEALLFASALPDREGGVQNALLTGFRYNGVDSNPDALTKHGLDAEVSWEWAPLSLGNKGTGADYHRFNLTVLGFYTLVERRGLSIYLADRLIYDHLAGAYIPVRARTTIGGFSKYPGFDQGLGGAVRGIAAGRFDGYRKAINNIELRLIYPEWRSYGVVPELIGYFDVGVTDQLTFSLDWDQVFSAVGIGIGLSDLILYGNYFFNEAEFSLNLALGIHF